MTGLICVNKPKDITSFGVVAKIRGITREKKAGHAGTLDPMATGVLPIALGGATKFLNYLNDSDKGYTASFILGKTTDTLDITGKVLTQSDVNVTKEELQAALLPFKGEIEQVVPMYSAVSVGGRRLYDIARSGQSVERPSKRVTIKSLCLEQFDGVNGVLSVFCTKGTYIRTLIDDLGASLGCGAVMSGLVRTSAAGFSIEQSKMLAELQEIRDSGADFSSVLVSVESLLSHYRSVRVSDAQAKRFSNGGALDAQRVKIQCADGEIIRVYSPDGDFIGLGNFSASENSIGVERLLVKRD